MMTRYDVFEEQPLHDGTLKDIEYPKGSYYVWVPTIATYSKEELEEVGIPIVDSVRYELGDITADMNYRPNQAMNVNQLIMVRWSLNEMVDAFVNGYRIAFENRSDVTKLNDIIEEYFDYIDNLIRTNEIRHYNVGDRLKNLDEFNKSIFNNNRAQIQGKRARIIKEASLINFLPDLIHTVVKPINTENIDTTRINTDGNMQISKYTIFDSDNNVIEENRNTNPLAPVYKEQPLIDFTKMGYQPRFTSPEERRLHNEHLRAKQILKDKQ